MISAEHHPSMEEVRRRVDEPDLRTAWRMHYQIPLSDPRVQDTPLDVITEDMVELALWADRYHDRDRAEVDRTAEDPGDVLKSGKAFAKSEDTLLKLKTLGMLGGLPRPPRVGRKKIQFRKGGGASGSTSPLKLKR